MVGLQKSSSRRTTAPAGPFYPHAVATRLRGWLRSSDFLVALGFVAASAIETVARHWDQPAWMVADLPGALLLGCLYLRRTRPLLAMTILGVGAALGTLTELLLMPPQVAGSADAVVPIFALLLITYSLGAYGTNRELALGAVVPLVLIVGIDLSEPVGYSLLGALPFFAVFVVGAPVLAGRLVRSRATMVRRLREQEHSLQEERAAATREAGALERLQLAQRLHGTLQAGMAALAARVAGTREADADQELRGISEIEAGARALLAETRKVLVSLASDAGPEATAPTQVVASAARPPARPEDGPGASALPWMVVAAAAICVGLMLETRASPGIRVALPLALLSCFAVAIPLALAPSRPLVMIASLWAAAALFGVLVAPLAGMFTAIGLVFLAPFAIAYLEGRLRAVLGLGICCLGELACFGPEALLSNAVMGVGAWLAGRVLRDRSRLIAELRTNNLQLAEQRENARRRAVLVERATVVRELHDSIGHALTVIALQAGAARRMWNSDRIRSADTLRTIERVARGAYEELQLPTVNAQSPRLSELDELLTGARAAGLRVDLRLDGGDVSLPPDIELAAYRLVQEALTNVLKHAPGAAAQVSIHTAPSHVDLLVVNSPVESETVATQPHGGQGLQGMQQRVEACGGRLDWGPRSDGGFEVRARFRLAAAI